MIREGQVIIPEGGGRITGVSERGWFPTVQKVIRSLLGPSIQYHGIENQDGKQHGRRLIVGQEASHTDSGAWKDLPGAADGSTEKNYISGAKRRQLYYRTVQCRPRSLAGDERVGTNDRIFGTG